MSCFLKVCVVCVSENVKIFNYFNYNVISGELSCWITPVFGLFGLIVRKSNLQIKEAVSVHTSKATLIDVTKSSSLLQPDFFWLK